MTKERINSWLFWGGALAILAGLILTAMSWMEICTESCASVHDYRFCGCKFELLGFIYFPLLGIAHIAGRRSSFMYSLAGFMVAAGVGSELAFIALQKYVINGWCIICLSIAATVGLVAVLYLASYFINTKNTPKGALMNGLWKLGIIVATFLFTFFGAGKIDMLEAGEETIHEKIAIGNPNGNIEAFLFTDWGCPACHLMEPNLVTIVPALKKQGRIIFVDYPIHPITLNYTPFNLAFMVHHKDQYIPLRHALVELSKESDSPTEHQIEALAKEHGATFQELPYADVAYATAYFKDLVKDHKVRGTPTMVIVNTDTGDVAELVGWKAITLEEVEKAIQSLQE